MEAKIEIIQSLAIFLIDVIFLFSSIGREEKEMIAKPIKKKKIKMDKRELCNFLRWEGSICLFREMEKKKYKKKTSQFPGSERGTHSLKGKYWPGGRE